MPAIVDLPTSLRPTLLEGLLRDLRSEAETNNLPHHKAFSKVALSTLGNDDDDFTYSTDGSRDRGIDHYRLSADAAEIFQCKSRDFLDGRNIDTPASEEVLADIPRILTLLKSHKAPATDANRSIKKFLHRFASEIESFKQSLSKVGARNEAPTRDYTITIKLVALANGLTAAALQTLERYRKQYMVMDLGGLDVLIDIQALFIDDLLRTRWKERNAQWRDIKGKNRDQISVARIGTVIKDKKSWVFYGNAVDLDLSPKTSLVYNESPSPGDGRCASRDLRKSRSSGF